MPQSLNVNGGIRRVDRLPLKDGYQTVNIVTVRGLVNCRYAAVLGAKAAVVLLGGASGGWDSPAGGLYQKLAEELPSHGIAVLWLRYRCPANLNESIEDLKAGMAFMLGLGVERLGIVGWSFGGTVAIGGGLIVPAVKLVVGIATQSYGLSGQRWQKAEFSLLLLHGEADETISASSSWYIYNLAKEPKQIVIYPEAGHGLTEAREEVAARVSRHLYSELG